MVATETTCYNYQENQKKTKNDNDKDKKTIRTLCRTNHCVFFLHVTSSICNRNEHLDVARVPAGQPRDVIHCSNQGQL